jgi:endonuclease YncB( thermonuclease family)
VGNTGKKSRPITRRRFGVALASLAAGCSGQADLSAGEQGRVSRITDGDVLGLDTGLRVRLVEIEAPAPGYDGRSDEPYAPEARAALTIAALGRQARLWYGGLSRDSYERALAHVIASDETGGDVWLNGYMVRQGGARVRTYPDNSRRARKLLAMEDEARSSKRGLWALDHWRVRSLDDLSGAPNFAIVEGPIGAIGQVSGDSVAHLDRAGIRLDIGEKLGAPDAALNLTAGSGIRIRGRIDRRSGEPRIRITHWAQLEQT